ncbi:Endonuclease V [Seminavis robusta]|uniref:Endonuclease V n=1 Tax=Seminavis robusta TaxID=568900 RepID=A0A9N8DEN8_9STRA|nr:Endonuclease V [Seminavis robusta]|eukprot:Sro54_g031740.1 Endonuclease V (341) ;mRNA; f:31414-32436
MDLEEQKEVWRKEQLELASQVEVLADESTSSDRFQSLPLIPLETSSTDDGTKDSPLYYGGVDVSFPTDENDQSVAVYVIVECPSGKVVYKDHEYYSLTMPYIPSYLAFREIEPLERLIQKQRKEQPKLTPRAILVDGNGVLHPRKAGIACFVGVRTGIPTIGVGKTLFYEGKLNKDLVLQELGEALHDAKQAFLDKDTNNVKNSQSKTTSKSPLCDTIIMDSKTIPKPSSAEKLVLDRGALVKELSTICRGVAVPLVNEEGEVLACALVGHGGLIRTKASVTTGGTKNPIYISVGHKLSLQESVRICASFAFAKIPEPVRRADLIGRELLRCKEAEKNKG